MPQSRPQQGRTARDLVQSGEVTASEAYYAAVVLERLQDRGIGRALTLEDVCEILGYCGDNRPPPTTRHRTPGGV